MEMESITQELYSQDLSETYHFKRAVKDDEIWNSKKLGRVFSSSMLEPLFHSKYLTIHSIILQVPGTPHISNNSIADYSMVLIY